MGPSSQLPGGSEGGKEGKQAKSGDMGRAEVEPAR